MANVNEPELRMFNMDPITVDLEKVDMGPAVVLFNNKVVGGQIRRPQKQVDQDIADLVSDIDLGGVAVTKQGYVNGRIRDGGKGGVTDHLVKKEVWVTECPRCDDTVAKIVMFGWIQGQGDSPQRQAVNRSGGATESQDQQDRRLDGRVEAKQEGCCIGH